jgi:hypothetical protein
MMAAMTVADSIKAQLDDAAYIIREQMARIAELEAEVERLRSAAGAHDVLRSIYSDTNQPTGHRLKAAGIAIGHEEPKIQSVPPPLELVANDPDSSLPLAELVAKRRARQKALEPPHRVIDHQVVLIKGNGSNDDDPAG